MDEEDRLRSMLHRVTAQDHRLMNALTRREVPPWVDRGLRLVTHAGGATATMTISLLLLLNPSTRHLGLVATMANLLSHLLVQGLKRTVSRPRPSALLPQVTALTAIPDHYSLPSGHACAAMALATTILLAEPALGSGRYLQPRWSAPRGSTSESTIPPTSSSARRLAPGPPWWST